MFNQKNANQSERNYKNLPKFDLEGKNPYIVGAKLISDNVIVFTLGIDGGTPKTTAKINRYAITTIKGVSILWGYMPWGICPLKYGTVAECMKARYERRCYE